MAPRRLTAVSVAMLLSLGPYAAANPTIDVAEPQLVFKPVDPVIWVTEPAITADEIALSQELGSLVRQSKYRETLQRLNESEVELSAPFEVLRAQISATLNDNASAIRAYRAALDKAPSFTRAHAGLGTLYLIEGKLSDAHKHLAEAVRLGAGDAQTFAQLGYLNVKLGNPWGAVSAYERALVLEPKNTGWKQALLLALTASGDYSTARSLLENLLAERPNDASLWQQRADLSLRVDDRVSALASLEMSLRLGDKSTDNRRAAAQLAMQLGNARRGSELASAAILAGSKDMDFVSQLADWMVRNGQEQYANNVLAAMGQRLNSYSPSQQSRYYFIKGRIAEKNGDTAQAVADFRRAIDRDGSNGQALLAYAEGALSSSNATRALLAFQRLAAIPAYRQQGLVGQAKAMIAQQDYPSALQKLKETIDEFPDAYELNTAIQSLTAIVNTRRDSAAL
ncbi:MAG: tetratricopeptide repeat protein [Pseudomonadota bacterium]